MINKNINFKSSILNKKGFTLVELLIVIAIIGVLSALLMANFIGVRQRARDAQRKSDIRQIQTALELYRSDLGYYPVSLDSCAGGLGAIDNGSTVYMSKIPCDPNNAGFNSGDYYYKPVAGQSSYDLIACLENGSDSQATPHDNLPITDDGLDDGILGNTANCPTQEFYFVKSP